LTRYAFFATPTEFRVDLRRPTSTDAAENVTALMTLSGLSWRVTRIVLPIVKILSHGTGKESELLERLKRPK